MVTHRHLKLPEILAYNLAMLGNNILANGLMFLALPIYSIGLGLNPAWIGLALMIPRLWDAISDPLMGYISDNTRSRWGRRKPYILCGAIFGGLFYVLLWNPPTEVSNELIMVYFCVCSIIMLTAYTVFIVPHAALGVELTSDVKERNRLMSIRVSFMGVAGLMLPWSYSLSFFPYFGTNEIEGIRVVGILFGSIIVLSGMLPALVCKENPEASKQEKIKIGPVLKSMVKNRPFLMLTGTYTLQQLGFFIVLPMSTFIGLYFIYAGDPAAKTENAKLFGMLGSSWAAVTLLSGPLIAILMNKIGRKATLITGLTITSVGMLSTWYFFTPDRPYLSILSYCITSPGNAMVLAAIPAMLADVCDYDEWLNGLRREGVFNSVNSFVFKAGSAAAAGLTGLFISMAGIDTTLGASEQSQQAVTNLRLMFALIPFGLMCSAFLCILFYPLSEKRMAQYRKEIDERKNKAGATG